MELYIDKENLFSLLKTRKTNTSLYDDCIRMMRRNLDVRFNFQPSQLSPDDREIFDAFFEDLNYSGSQKTFLNSPFPERPLKSNCYNFFTMGQLSSIYLLNDPKTNCVAQKDCILIGTLGQEAETLSQLFFDDYQYSEGIPVEDFNGSWKHLSNWVRPATDIIFIDRFILDDVSLYESNLYSLLECLTEKNSEMKMNIVIIISNDKTGSMPPEKIKSEIERKISAKNRRFSVNVTIVPLSYDLREHDRTIVTNYIRYHSGDSFNYFNSRHGVETKGRDFNISSLASIQNHNLVKNLLRDIQQKIDEQKKRNPNFFIGNGNCNFLKIN